MTVQNSQICNKLYDVFYKYSSSNHGLIFPNDVLMHAGIPFSIFFILWLTAGEYCLWGKVSLESLYMAWDCFPNFRLGQRAEIMSTVDLLPCILKVQ